MRDGEGWYKLQDCGRLHWEEAASAIEINYYQ